MDILTLAIITAAVAALAARLVEIGRVRPDAFAEIGSGARRFAERALAESAALRRAHRARDAAAPADASPGTTDRPLAA